MLASRAARRAPIDVPPNKPLKLTAAGFSRATAVRATRVVTSRAAAA
jgi:hypothetical protein